MATVREHFDTTAKALNALREWHLSLGGESKPIVILGKISHHLEENAKYWSFYIPTGADLSCVSYLLKQPNVSECIIKEGEHEQIIGYADSPERQSLGSFHFTRRIYLYIEDSIQEEQKKALVDFGESLNFGIKGSGNNNN